MSESYTAIMQLSNSVFTFCLSSVEKRVLDFIIQRTLRFNKNHEVIPIRHFIDGVYDMDDKVICFAACTSKQKLFQALKSLASNGYIHISRVGRANRYGVYEQDLIALGAKAMSHLKEARQKKRLESNQKKKARWFTTEPHIGSQVNHLNGSQVNHRSNRSKVTDSEVMESTASQVDAIKSAQQKNKQAKLEKEEKARTRKNMGNATVLWNASLREHCPEAPPARKITGKQWGPLKANTVSMEGPEFAAFLSWTVENWSVLARHDLKWVDDITDVPDLFLFARLSKHFVAAYANESARGRGIGARHSASQRDTGPDGTSAATEAELARRDAQKAREEAAHYKRLLLESKRAKKEKILQSSANQDIPESLPDNWENSDGV
jgi:hypothetical protein